MLDLHRTVAAAAAAAAHPFVEPVQRSKHSSEKLRSARGGYCCYTGLCVGLWFVSLTLRFLSYFGSRCSSENRLVHCQTHVSE